MDLQSYKAAVVLAIYMLCVIPVNYLFLLFEAALDYKPRILGPKIEGFSFLVHKLSVISTALQYTL